MSSKKKSQASIMSQQQSTNDSFSQSDSFPDDEFRILIASDIHLGFAEKDPIRGEDSFNSFEEVLQIGLREKADFVLLGGDLFHENKPSPKSLTKCVEILRRYSMGDGEILFDLVSDPETSFSHSEYFKNINYMDDNLNIQLPIFSIHGNHDDPYGKDLFSVLDILSTSGLINYFGKQTNMDKIEVSPILLNKKDVKVALYGIGSLPEERFHRYIANDKVTFLKLDDNEKWFNIFVVHQNRVRHGTKYLPEHCLTKLPDFVVWGHEHQAKEAAEYNSQNEFYIYQPGSTVATSLCQGETDPKKVGLLRVRIDQDGEFELQLTPIKLTTVRQFYMETVSLNEHFDKIGKKHATIVDVEEFCSTKIEEMIEKATEEHSGDARQPKLPLIRLRVEYTDEYLTLSSNHFGQRFVGRVANPKDLILFKCKKIHQPKMKTFVDTNVDMIEDIYEGMYESEERLKHCGIDDVINEYFENVEQSSKLTLLAEKKLTDAVREIVDKDPQSSKINMIIDWHITKIKEHIMKKSENVEKILQDRLLLKEIMQDFKDQLRKKEEAEDRDLVDFEDLNEQYGRKKASKPPKVVETKGKGRGKKANNLDSDTDEDEDIQVIENANKMSDDENSNNASGGLIEIIDNDSSDMEDTPSKNNSSKKKPATRGRGRGRGARGGARGRGSSKQLSDFFTVSK